ncbi:uncharacterized protein LOC130974764 [Arachis stenosperma]|uniref:uncharacterized protein LOC130974764 n=1 Tax=Arachis stenosperma TaxID=217475 RepID=UPI0025AC249F|nr:uncharacterized protein LOC130974764 [Arachis stenosperma]
MAMSALCLSEICSDEFGDIFVYTFLAAVLSSLPCESSVYVSLRQFCLRFLVAVPSVLPFSSSTCTFFRQFRLFFFPIVPFVLSSGTLGTSDTTCPTRLSRPDQIKYHDPPNFSKNVPASSATIAATESTSSASLNPSPVSLSDIASLLNHMNIVNLNLGLTSGVSLVTVLNTKVIVVGILSLDVFVYLVMFDDFTSSISIQSLEPPTLSPSPSPDDSRPDDASALAVMLPPSNPQLVAQGCMQEYGIDYEETFARVSRITSICALLAINEVRKWSFSQMDVKNAFLNGDLKNKVYMKPSSDILVLLAKSVSVIRHFVVLNKILVNGLTSSAPRYAISVSLTTLMRMLSLFVKVNVGLFLLLLYVDDVIITRDDIDGISDLKASLHHAFDMKDLSSLSYFLGLEVIFSDDGIYLSQAKYASDFLARFGVTNSRTESTPLEPNVR